MTKVASKGRNLQQIVSGQMISTFTTKEESPLKQNIPFKVRTQIWAIENYPLFIGYGSIAISDADGKITRESDLGDLVIFYTSNNGQTIHIFYLAGMITYLDEAAKYLSENI
ncbi:hypothetical protein [Bacteroides cellulosilyticus]|uniref:hypothetical protein n=1 Tax=Bacteroides cellulosilyticus TaxID=246787 RepID=UPI001A92C8D2|nr:hypothetical protein [Bacteroides cellulosilyticus]